jgi:hypothetical protein
MNEWMNEPTNERTNEQMNKWTNEQMNEWTNKETNERMNKQLKEWMGTVQWTMSWVEVKVIRGILSTDGHYRYCILQKMWIAWPFLETSNIYKIQCMVPCTLNVLYLPPKYLDSHENFVCLQSNRPLGAFVLPTRTDCSSWWPLENSCHCSTGAL